MPTLNAGIWQLFVFLACDRAAVHDKDFHVCSRKILFQYAGDRLFDEALAIISIDQDRDERGLPGDLTARILFKAAVRPPIEMKHVPTSHLAVHFQRNTKSRYSLSIFAARMKSLSVRPLILCVHVVTSALPHVSRTSG